MTSTSQASGHLLRLDVSVILFEASGDAKRTKAAEAAEAAQAEAVQRAAEVVLKAFNYSASIPDARQKCVRDLTIVHRHCIYAMLTDDQDFLQQKLLSWLQPVLQSREFPGGAESIRGAYSVLRQETLARVDAEAGELLEPYLTLAVNQLSQKPSSR